MENEYLLRYIENSDKTANRWKKLDVKAISFWYRQSPHQLEAVAAAVFILFYGLGFGPGNIYELAICLTIGALWFFVLMRFGLVAMLLGNFSFQPYAYFPTTLNASAWYRGDGLAALVIFAAIVLYAFRTSLGGRPFLAPPASTTDPGIR